MFLPTSRVRIGINPPIVAHTFLFPAMEISRSSALISILYFSVFGVLQGTDWTGLQQLPPVTYGLPKLMSIAIPIKVMGIPSSATLDLLNMSS
jgi:hypothetical protein